MHKLVTLLLALLMVTVNAFAAVNVNTANKDELQMLTGIGPAKAQAIIDYRTKNGAFKTVDDLIKVPGIGPAVLGKMKSDVVLTGSTTGKPAAGTDAAKTAVPPSGEAAKPAATPAAPAPAAAAKTEPAKTAAPAPTVATPAAPASAAKTAATPATAPAAAATATPAPTTGAPATAAKAQPAKSEPPMGKEDPKKASKKDKKDASTNADGGTAKK